MAHGSGSAHSRECHGLFCGERAGAAGPCRISQEEFGQVTGAADWITLDAQSPSLEERAAMFERYTEKARRVIFFARYEASQFGSPFIESEHLLLGILREDKELSHRFLSSQATFESLRRQIEQHTTIRESIPTSVDLPLSNECKRVLAYAAEEAERLAHKHIGTEHLLLGLLREEQS